MRLFKKEIIINASADASDEYEPCILENRDQRDSQTILLHYRDQLVSEIVEVEKKEYVEDTIPSVSSHVFGFNASGNGFNAFVEVLKQNSNAMKNPSIIIDAMNAMNLGDREKGRTDSTQKFKSLFGRWFDKGVQPVVNN